MIILGWVGEPMVLGVVASIGGTDELRSEWKSSLELKFS